MYNISSVLLLFWRFQMEKALVIPGFKTNLVRVLDDDTASFDQLAKLLVFQPSIIALLFGAAVKICNEMHCAILHRPQSVHGIINVLGFNGVIRQIDNIEEVSYEKRDDIVQNAIVQNARDTYESSRVLARFAEIEFGWVVQNRVQAQNFFLYGCLAGTGDQELIDSFNESQEFSRHLSSSKDANIPSPAIATALVKQFRKHGRTHVDGFFTEGFCGYKEESFKKRTWSSLYDEWESADHDISFMFRRIAEESKSDRPLYAP